MLIGRDNKAGQIWKENRCGCHATFQRSPINGVASPTKEQALLNRFYVPLLPKPQLREKLIIDFSLPVVSLSN